jgi:hypothetical protein
MRCFMVRLDDAEIEARATHEGALTHCSLADLKRFAIDLA